MDEFTNYNEINEDINTPESEECDVTQDEQIRQQDSGNEYFSSYEPVSYSPVAPVDNYKPMSKGLKVFSLIMAAVIVLTGSCLAGYFIGKNSGGFTSGTSSTIDLSARPKDTDEMTPAEVYEKVNTSIVGILVYNASGEMSQASGIVFSEDGYIVTNDHIYSEIAAPKFKIYAYDGKEYDAKYVAGDVVSDLAVLKVDSASFTPVEFGNSDELYYGQNVVAIGRPSDATDASSITNGIISAVNRRVTTTSSYSARVIQTSCAINPGSSGGALVDMYGQVVGVTASKLVSAEYENVGYAIPTTVMKRVVDELISEGKVVTRAKLGITYSFINSAMVEISDYSNTGVYIASVSEESGLYGQAEEGDIITHINDIEITDERIILDIIEQHYAGDTISVTIVTKEGATKTVSAVLKQNLSESSYNEIPSNIQDGSGNSGSNGGTFDFPYGE